MVKNFNFGVNISNSLSRSNHIEVMAKKAHQLPQEPKFSMSPTTITDFYKCTIVSRLSDYSTSWFGNNSALYILHYLHFSSLHLWCRRMARLYSCIEWYELTGKYSNKSFVCILGCDNKLISIVRITTVFTIILFFQLEIMNLFSTIYG